MAERNQNNRGVNENNSTYVINEERNNRHAKPFPKKIIIISVAATVVVITGILGVSYKIYSDKIKKTSSKQAVISSEDSVNTEGTESLSESVSNAESSEQPGNSSSESSSVQAKIEAAIKSEQAQIKPSTGKVTTAPEFKDDGKEDGGEKHENVDVDNSKGNIVNISVPATPSVTSQTSSVTVSQKYTVRVTGTDINVRTGAGTANSSIGKINSGDFGYISEGKDSSGILWYNISYNGKSGWISSAYSKKVDIAAEKPASSSSAVKPPVSSASSASSATSSSSSSGTATSSSASSGTTTSSSTPAILNGWSTDKKYYYINNVLLKGWADIAGQRYYFDTKTGEKKSMVGIDVSSHQGDINWASVKQAGVEFAIIRVGYRGYGSGKLCIDDKFTKNITEAKKAGIKCGVYFYSVAINEIEAVQEANLVLEAIKGYTLDLPIVIDVENPPEADNRLANNKVTKQQRTTNTIAFLTTIIKAGKQGMLYTGYNYYFNNLERTRLASYPLWIAYYTNDNTKVADVNYSYWQYSSSGTVSGITGRTDMDIFIQK